MGTWDIGPFDNDSASEAIAALADGSFRMDQFRFECGRGPLGTDDAALVIALAAVLNGFVPTSALTAALDYPFTLDDKKWIRSRAEQAVRPGRSELYDLWENTGELDKWLAETRKYVA